MPVVVQMLHRERKRIRVLVAAVLSPKRLLKNGEFRVSLREGNAGLESPHHYAELVGVHAGHQANRDGKLDSTAAYVGTGLHHADNRIRLVVDQDGLARD